MHLKLLSAMQLLEIQDPVTDQKGYVYDRASVLFYIKEQGGSAQCPAGRSLYFCNALLYEQLSGYCTLSLYCMNITSSKAA